MTIQDEYLKSLGITGYEISMIVENDNVCYYSCEISDDILEICIQAEPVSSETICEGDLGIRQLHRGVNSFSIRAVKQGKTEREYRISVVVKRSILDVNVSVIEVNGEQAKPVIRDGEIVHYYQCITYTGEPVSIEALPSDSNTIVEGDVGFQEVSEGVNSFVIILKSEDGRARKNYHLVVECELCQDDGKSPESIELELYDTWQSNPMALQSPESFYDPSTLITKLENNGVLDSEEKESLETEAVYDLPDFPEMDRAVSEYLESINAAKESSDMKRPDLETPEFESSKIENPELENSEFENSQIENPNFGFSEIDQTDDVDFESAIIGEVELLRQETDRLNLLDEAAIHDPELQNLENQAVIPPEPSQIESNSKVKKIKTPKKKKKLGGLETKLKFLSKKLQGSVKTEKTAVRTTKLIHKLIGITLFMAASSYLLNSYLLEPSRSMLSDRQREDMEVSAKRQVVEQHLKNKDSMLEHINSLEEQIANFSESYPPLPSQEEILLYLDELSTSIIFEYNIITIGVPQQLYTNDILLDISDKNLGTSLPQMTSLMPPGVQLQTETNQEENIETNQGENTQTVIPHPFVKNSATLAITGKYDSLMQVYDKIINNPRIIVTDNIQLSRNDSSMIAIENEEAQNQLWSMSLDLIYYSYQGIQEKEEIE